MTRTICVEVIGRVEFTIDASEDEIAGRSDEELYGLIVKSEGGIARCLNDKRDLEDVDGNPIGMWKSEFFGWDVEFLGP